MESKCAWLAWSDVPICGNYHTFCNNPESDEYVLIGGECEECGLFCTNEERRDYVVSEA